MRKGLPITKQMVWEAYLHVKKNKGGPGEDGMRIIDFEEDLGGHLYKLWNRLTSGCYYPPLVKEVGIKKPDGGIRYLGIPTITDRIAQQVVRSYLEPRLEAIFHVDSYGYRPGRSAHGALRQVRRRNWRYGWVVDLDIRRFFDTVDHHLLRQALLRHIDDKQEGWLLLYITRWLEAGILKESGDIEEERKLGTPQGGVISPLLSNLFLHYAFDVWMDRNFPGIQFTRYADDIIVHCKTREEAEEVLERICCRLETVGLSLHPTKTKLVRCKSVQFTEVPAGIDVSFVFLGFEFKPSSQWSPRDQRKFLGYNCRMSRSSKQEKQRELRENAFLRNTSLSIEELSKALNPQLRGWQTYFGLFKRQELRSVFHHLELRLRKWVSKKYKLVSKRAARAWLRRQREQNARLFYHWAIGCYW